MYSSHVLHPLGVDFEHPWRPKFEKDFIMLSEFSELVGPIPVCIIPEPTAAGNFNTNHFAVRIMSSDFQNISGKLVGPDTQVILTEKQDCAYAYVHYFSLNDNNARGFLRQYCFSYVTSSPSKIMDNFEPLLEEFSKVTAMLKVSNHRVFQKDLSHYLADLQCTIALLKEEGLSETSAVDYTQLYTGFDFTKEDVPERDVSQVVKSIEETNDILAALREELELEESKQVWNNLHRMREKYREQQRKDLKELERVNVNSERASSGFTSYLPMSPDSGARMSESLSSSDSCDYVPQRVMTHFVHKFERRLRPLEELTPKAHYIAMARVRALHTHFSRSALALEMEKEEVELLDPYSSLLTIGRVPVLNFLQNHFLDHKARDCLSSSSSSSFKCDLSCRCGSQSQLRVSNRISFQKPISCRISSKNTWGMPIQSKRAVLEVEKLGARHGFDTTFISDKLGLKHYPLYIEPIHIFNLRRQTSDSMAFSDATDHGNSLTPCLASIGPDSTNHMLTIPVPPPTSQCTRCTQKEEDGVSRASTCTTFATPEGFTPRSSDGELEEHYTGEVIAGVVETGGEEDGKEIRNELSVLSPRVMVELSGGMGKCSSGAMCSLSDGVRGERGSELTRGTISPHDGGLEVSSGSSVQFHSASQSTLTESKESRRADIREDTQGVGRCDMVIIGGNEASANNTEVCTLVVTSVEEAGGHGGWTSSSINSSTAPSASSINSNTAPSASSINSNTAPSASSINSNTAPSASSINSNTAPSASSINSNTAPSASSINSNTAPSVSSSNSNTSPSANSINSNTAPSVSSGNSNTAPSVSSSNSNTALSVSTSNSNTALSVSSSNSNTALYAASSSMWTTSTHFTELEESYSIGSNSYKFSSSGAGVSGDGVGGGRWVELEKLGGGLYYSQTNHLAKTRDCVVDNESPLLNSPGVPPLEEEGHGKLEWSKRRNTLLCLAYEHGLRRDKSSPDVFYTPSGKLSTGPVFFFHSGSSRSSSQPFLSLSSEAGSALNGLPHSLHLPLSPGMRSVSSMETDYTDTSIYSGPSMREAIGKTNLPLVSTLDHIESHHNFKPGKGIVNFCRDTPVVKDLFYCLLQGRPLVLLGKPTDENLIRRLIRVLWLFVPGHSSQRQVITWQEAPLDIRDLSRVKLIGLSNKVSGSLPAHIKRYVSCWDCSTGKLCTPSYNGDLLTPIVTRTKDKKNEEVFLTYIHSVLQDIAMKAFVYYHGYSASMTKFRRSPSFETSSKKFLTVLEKSPSKKCKIRYLQQQLGIKNSDVDIIEYFVDVIEEQLSVRWGISTPNGSPYDDKPVHLQLHTKSCTESFSCKPKKPY